MDIQSWTWLIVGLSFALYIGIAIAFNINVYKLVESLTSFTLSRPSVCVGRGSDAPRNGTSLDLSDIIIIFCCTGKAFEAVASKLALFWQNIKQYYQKFCKEIC